MRRSGMKMCLEDEEGWTNISVDPHSDYDSSQPGGSGLFAYPEAPESMQDRIVRISSDLHEIQKFYNIEGSPTRYARLSEFYESELAALSAAPFSSYSQDEKADYILLKNFLNRAQRNLELDRKREAEFASFVEPFAESIREWCEIRQRQRIDEIFEPQVLANSLKSISVAVLKAVVHVIRYGKGYSQATGSRAVRRVRELRKHMDETCDFYSGYHPSFDYWVSKPRIALDDALKRLETEVREVMIIGSDNDGDGDGEEDAIVGEPIGRDGLLVELEAEMIPYSPEELLAIAEREYTWCEREMKTATSALGYASWRDGLEHVKNLYEPATTHTQFVRELVAEGAAYVRKHDLVSVPRLAEEAITITRIPPSRQRVSPFFLGGHRLQISYPRADMAHADKLMTLRGNNRPFSRATAFHEMIPGHRLQVFVGDRSRPYRAKLFGTPFYVEGWALYWEMVFWERGDFFVSPEDKVGTLFWRMHRCMRIIFSLGFHLGRISAKECVELLVRRVGHEPSTAEGEVRRSLNGSYPPLYQAGYMLGALQLVKLRREVLGGRRLAEKEFHDRVLRANVMPIEMLRALLLDKELHEDFKAKWRFYGDV